MVILLSVLWKTGLEYSEQLRMQLPQLPAAGSASDIFATTCGTRLEDGPRQLNQCKILDPQECN